jgi:hypothetical protein
MAGSSHIKPGESGSIRVRVHFDNGIGIGKLVKRVLVYSNDPARPVVTLTLVGDY